MPITRNKEENLKKKIKYIVSEINNEYKILISSITNKEYKNLSKIIVINDDIKKDVEQAFELTIENYSFAPLGKDLRRNISYTMMTKSLKDISVSASTISKFIFSTYKFKKIKYDWILELSQKISESLTMTEELLESEDPEEAYKIIKKDETFLVITKKELEQFSDKLDALEFDKKQRNDIFQELILAIRSFEVAAENVNNIAEMSLFISTSKLY